MQLTAVDYVIITVYFLVVIGIGLAFSKRAGSSMTEFFDG